MRPCHRSVPRTPSNDHKRGTRRRINHLHRCQRLLTIVVCRKTDFIQNNNLEILNKRFQPATHKSGTNIDLTLSTSNIAQLLRSWSIFPEDSISDHNMIYFKLKLRQDFQTGILDKFSTKRANYELINQNISEQVDALQAMPEETCENIKKPRCCLSKCLENLLWQESSESQNRG